MSWDVEYMCVRCGHKHDDTSDKDHATWLCSWCLTQPCDRCYRPLGEGEHGLYKCPLQQRKATAVWADAIPGGIEIAHGLCNEDGTPRRFDSRSEIKAACEVKGLVPYHDVYQEGGNRRLEDARHHADWLQTSTAQREKRWRDEARAEKTLARR